MEGYRAFQNLSAAGVEAGIATTIDRDREYDQTAKTEPPLRTEHLHGIGVTCWCGVPNQTCECEAPTPLAVSPAILEFRIQELTDELSTERRLRGETIEKLLVANNRISAFEQMAAGLAAKVDEFAAGIQAMTGTASEFVARESWILDCGQPVATPNEGETGRCIFPAGHTGPCSIGV